MVTCGYSVNINTTNANHVKYRTLVPTQVRQWLNLQPPTATDAMTKNYCILYNLVYYKTSNNNTEKERGREGERERGERERGERGEREGEGERGRERDREGEGGKREREGGGRERKEERKEERKGEREQ